MLEDHGTVSSQDFAEAYWDIVFDNYADEKQHGGNDNKGDE